MNPLFHTLYFEATRNCNLNCQYCSTKSNVKEKYIDVETDKIIERVLKPAWDLGTRMIDFSGGEFLLRKDAFTLLKVANDMGFRISIVTNGTLLNQKMIDRLKDLLGGNLLISLGVNSFDNKNVETRDCEVDKTLELIDLLEKNGISMNLCVTIGKFNADSFADTISKINDLKLPYNRTPFTPRNFDCGSLMFDKETMREKIHPSLLKYYRGYVSYVPFLLTEEDYVKHSGQSHKDSKVPTSPSVGCWVGSFYGINAEGDVAPCPLLLDNVSGGNVYEQNLKDILFESDLFKNIVDRKQLKGKCGNCKYTYTCGGCRVMAYYQTGDVMAEDPTCFMADLSEKELQEMEKQTYKNFKNYYRMTNFGGVFKKPDATED
ncbi:MAG: radical SAM protein [Bacteroidales bacterium]|nr:radical SAM protein [Bacteroidales bacterium]